MYQCKRWVSEFLAVVVCLGSSGVHAESELTLSAGLREDALHWSISAVGGSPNILSELTWRALRSNYFQGQFLHRNHGIILRGHVGYGLIYAGYNQDSDYDGNNRTEEFSRSNNQTDGDSVSEMNLAIGLDMLSAENSNLQISPFFGYSGHEQKLRMTGGFQTVPATGAFGGLNSTYQTHWSGPMVGVDTSLRVNTHTLIRASYAHHFATYSAKANWNLRDCLAHPKSYEHEGTADGDTLMLSAEFEVATDTALFLKVDFSSWGVDSGQTYFFLPKDFYTRRNNAGVLVCIREADLPSEQVFKIYEPLNEVKWRANVYSLGINMRL